MLGSTGNFCGTDSLGDDTLLSSVQEKRRRCVARAQAGVGRSMSGQCLRCRTLMPQRCATKSRVQPRSKAQKAFRDGRGSASRRTVNTLVSRPIPRRVESQINSLIVGSNIYLRDMHVAAYLSNAGTFTRGCFCQPTADILRHILKLLARLVLIVSRETPTEGKQLKESTRGDLTWPVEHLLRVSANPIRLSENEVGYSKISEKTNKRVVWNENSPSASEEKP